MLTTLAECTRNGRLRGGFSSKTSTVILVPAGTTIVSAESCLGRSKLVERSALEFGSFVSSPWLLLSALGDDLGISACAPDEEAVRFACLDGVADLLATTSPSNSGLESRHLDLGWVVSHHFRHALESANLAGHANALSPVGRFRVVKL